jgi:ribonucleotide monophosphatase NagD (HAD superfamily)
MSKVVTKQAKLLASFETGASLTTKQMKARFGLANPQSAIRELREQGYAIYANETKTGTKYRLGKPSRRMVALAAKIAGADIFSR